MSLSSAAAPTPGALFACVGNILILANEGYLSFYSVKSLKKFRTQLITEDATIIGVGVVKSGSLSTSTLPNSHDTDRSNKVISSHGRPSVDCSGYSVHAIDSNGGYYSISLGAGSPLSSTTDSVNNYPVSSVLLSDVLGDDDLTSCEKKKNDEEEGNASTHHSQETTGASTSHSIFTEIYSAYWFTAPPDSTHPLLPPGTAGVAWLTSAGVTVSSVYQILGETKTAKYSSDKPLRKNDVRGDLSGPFDDNEEMRKKYIKLLTFEVPIRNILMAIGSGTVVVGQKGKRWLWAAGLPAVRKDSSLEAYKKFQLSCDLQSIAVCPFVGGGSGASSVRVAVGGIRGELCYYPSISQPQTTFSDHWHHTPLSAMAFSVDGSTLLTGGHEHQLMSWDVGTTFKRSKVSGGTIPGDGAMVALVPSVTDPACVMACFADHTVCSVDLRQRKVLGVAEGVHWSQSQHPHHLQVQCIKPNKNRLSGSSKASHDHTTNQENNLGHHLSTIQKKCHHVISSESIFQKRIRQFNIANNNSVGLVNWMGKPAVMVLGQDTVKICDPMSMQAIHSLHVSFNMEAPILATNADGDILNEEATGLTHAACSSNGKIIFTYEHLAPLGIPSALRVWAYDQNKKKHVEVQTIFTPHQGRMVAMVVDESSVVQAGGEGVSFVTQAPTLYTCDARQIKKWAPTAASLSDTVSVYHERQQLLQGGGSSTGISWRPKGRGLVLTGSSGIYSMTLSEDGSTLAVADDSIHFFMTHSITSCDNNAIAKDKAGDDGYDEGIWNKVLFLTQPHTTSPLTNITINMTHRAIVARAVDGSFLFRWVHSAESNEWELIATPNCVSVAEVPIGTGGDYQSDIPLILVAQASIIETGERHNSKENHHQYNHHNETEVYQEHIGKVQINLITFPLTDGSRREAKEGNNVVSNDVSTITSSHSEAHNFMHSGKITANALCIQYTSLVNKTASTQPSTSLWSSVPTLHSSLPCIIIRKLLAVSVSSNWYRSNGGETSAIRVGIADFGGLRSILLDTIDVAGKEVAGHSGMSVQSFTAAPVKSDGLDAGSDSKLLKDYFSTASHSEAQENGESRGIDGDRQNTVLLRRQSDHINVVLSVEAYAAPPMSSVLSTLLGTGAMRV
eukprot:Tbor_TRINITY_DN4874_c0_g1::TRINITY_DN4874_c0_g1_i1::g.1224::m.1224